MNHGTASARASVHNKPLGSGPETAPDSATEGAPPRATMRASPFDVPDHACRPDCGACCIAPSISSPIPGMPEGKPAGVRCVQLGDDLRCRIFGQPQRPACCSGLQPQTEMCGANRREALAWLTQLEAQTRPHAADC